MALTAVVLLGALAAPGQQRAAEPAPLMVTAMNRSGDITTGAGSWWTVLRDPGQSTFREPGDGTGDAGKPTDVSRERLKALRDAVEGERFFNLRKEYGYFAPDGPEMRIKVKLGGKTHEVVVGSIEDHMSRKVSAEVDRFMRVWFAVRDCLPQAAQ